MFHESDIDRLRSATAYDPNGERIGNIGEVYLDDQTGKPMWVTVHTGFFGMNTSFVPLAGATFSDDDHLVVSHHKDVVKDAPNISEDGHLDRAQEDELYRYYGVSGDEVAADAMRTRRWTDESDYAGDRRDDGSLFDRDNDGRGPVGEVMDGPDGTPGDTRGDRGLDPHGNRGYAGDTGDVRDDGSLFDRDNDGRGPVGEALDGPDGRRGDRVYDDPAYSDRTYSDRADDPAYSDRAYDDRADGPMFDKDRDGRGPIEEVLDGPDDPRNPRRN